MDKVFLIELKHHTLKKWIPMSLKKDSSLEIKTGNKGDIKEILSLQNYWLGKTADSEEGFLFGSPYSKEELKKITSKGHVFVAMFQEKIIGFFLVDDVSGNKLTEEYKKHLNSFESILKEKICARAQIAISPEYLGLGISKKLTIYLKNRLKNEFDSVFSIVSKKNKNLPKHLKNGWEVVHETQEFYYVKLNL